MTYGENRAVIHGPHVCGIAVQGRNRRLAGVLDLLQHGANLVEQLVGLSEDDQIAFQFEMLLVENRLLSQLELARAGLDMRRHVRSESREQRQGHGVLSRGLGPVGRRGASCSRS